MNTEELHLWVNEFCEEHCIDEEVMLADGFEDAFIGIGVRFTHVVSVYSQDKCLSILTERDGMTFEEAVEFFDFNVTGAYVGDSTPVFMIDMIEK